VAITIVGARTGTEGSRSDRNAHFFGGGNPLSALECYLSRMKLAMLQGSSPRMLTLKQWSELDEDDEGELLDGVLET